MWHWALQPCTIAPRVDRPTHAYGCCMSNVRCTCGLWRMIQPRWPASPTHTAMESFGMGLEWCRNYRCAICADRGNYPRDGLPAPKWFVGVPRGTRWMWVNAGQCQEHPDA